ncbi:MAG: GNAT family N-acetyltransferase, partial [Gammaproteobacteria bacterium]|nr:GNAT family N-acetyltransferase [Gammaproteobacteria bacterium]
MGSSDLIFRPAQAADLPQLVAMLADDPLGTARECLSEPLPQAYAAAFSAIEDDPNNELTAAWCDDRIVAMLQLTFIPYLTHQGSWRALIEGVRVHKDYRSHGIGKSLLSWAIERARQRNCGIVQLTTDKARPDALRFYRQLGFQASHEGMKLHLDGAP